TFAPILYLIRYNILEEAIAYQNGVRQGLSSAIMTTDMRQMERFLSVAGSDCGIANVNIGTSGAEIGGSGGGHEWRLVARERRARSPARKAPAETGARSTWGSS